ncbi:MAG: hypothetical protein HOQ36_05965, partial [Nocardia sp.]|nr:hypothetical protein [Nocardia sp.]
MSTATDADIDTPGNTADGGRPPGPRPGDPRPGDPRPGDPRPGDPRPGSPVPGSAEDRPTTLIGKRDPATGEPISASTAGPGAGGSDIEGGLLVASKEVKNKPKYTIALVLMKVESETNDLVNSFIADAEDAMQKSVDVLGFGRSDPPPPPKGGKTPDKVQAANLPGSGKGFEMYQQQVFSAGTRQDSLVDMDAQVVGTSQLVAAEQANTLLKIRHIEKDLNAALLTVASKKLTSAQAAAVMDHIAAAVAKVNEVVTSAQDVNVAAGGGGGGSGGSGGGGA